MHYNGLIKQEQFSVEHLLPLSPEQGSVWMQNFVDEKSRRELTELLGNLFLVRDKTENMQMKNYDYPQKHGILFANGADHPISLTNELKQQPRMGSRQHRPAPRTPHGHGRSNLAAGVGGQGPSILSQLASRMGSAPHPVGGTPSEPPVF